MTDSKVPQPGPAKLKRNAGPDEWLEAAKDCKHLSEAHMKQLCEMVKEYMMEGEYADVGLNLQMLTGSCYRIQHSARLYTRHHLRRYSRPVLRPSRTLPRLGRHARWH